MLYSKMTKMTIETAGNKRDNVREGNLDQIQKVNLGFEFEGE